MHMQGHEYKNQVSAARIYMHVLYRVEWSLEAQEHYFPEYCFISMAENWTAYSEKSTNVFHWKGKVVRVSAPIFTRDVERKLQSLKWISRRTPRRPFRFDVVIYATEPPKFILLFVLLQCRDQPYYWWIRNSANDHAKTGISLDNEN